MAAPEAIKDPEMTSLGIRCYDPWPTTTPWVNHDLLGTATYGEKPP